MERGEDEGDDELRPPLPPEDRVWRHPSEVAQELAATSTAGSPAPAPWGTAFFSAVGGALVVGVLWLTVGGGTSESTRVATEFVALVPVETVAPKVVAPTAWTSEVSKRAQPATVAVRGDDGATVGGAVLVRDDGYLVTSAAAVSGNGQLSVIDPAGEARLASIIGIDPETDLSVLRIDGTTWEPAVVADGAMLDAGESVALVHPDGDPIERIVTERAGVTNVDGTDLVGLASLDDDRGDVPPGSPAVDATGAIVGITTGTDSDSMASIVPMDVARDVIEQLIKSGTAVHPRLGVTATDAEDVDGAEVVAVPDGGPAAVAGVRVGDIIVAVEGVAVASMPEMVRELRGHEPGEQIGLTVDRDGESHELVALLATSG